MFYALDNLVLDYKISDNEFIIFDSDDKVAEVWKRYDLFRAMGTNEKVKNNFYGAIMTQGSIGGYSSYYFKNIDKKSDRCIRENFKSSKFYETKKGIFSISVKEFLLRDNLKVSYILVTKNKSYNKDGSIYPVYSLRLIALNDIIFTELNWGCFDSGFCMDTPYYFTFNNKEYINLLTIYEIPLVLVVDSNTIYLSYNYKRIDLNFSSYCDDFFIPYLNDLLYVSTIINSSLKGYGHRNLVHYTRCGYKFEKNIYLRFEFLNSIEAKKDYVKLKLVKDETTDYKFLSEICKVDFSH